MGFIIILLWLEFSGGREAGWEIRGGGFAARPSAFSWGRGERGGPVRAQSAPERGRDPAAPRPGPCGGGERRRLLQVFSETGIKEA